MDHSRLSAPAACSMLGKFRRTQQLFFNNTRTHRNNRPENIDKSAAAVGHLPYRACVRLSRARLSFSENGERPVRQWHCGMRLWLVEKGICYSPSSCCGVASYARLLLASRFLHRLLSRHVRPRYHRLLLSRLRPRNIATTHRDSSSSGWC